MRPVSRFGVPALLLFGLALSGACTADKAIEEGTDCEQTCPVGAMMEFAKEASGTCGADGSYQELGKVSASGQCKGSGECQVVCKYPECGEGKTLVISEDEYLCKASLDPCGDAKCPVGAQLTQLSMLAGTCSADGSFTPEGGTSPTGRCEESGECQFVCVYPKCESNQTLVITETEFRCEASDSPCAGITCSGHGECRIVDDAPVCDCEEGYVANGAYCDPPPAPVLTSIEPDFATIGVRTRFTIIGTNLPMTLSAEVAQCSDLAFREGRTASQQEFDCTPAAPPTSAAKRSIYSEPGVALYSDFIEIRCADCTIGGICYEEEAPHPTESCKWCDPNKSYNEWSNNDGELCDDGEFCNGSDVCKNGTCSQHASNPCPDDGLHCNGQETCDSNNGECIHVNVPCQDDGVVCDGAEICDEATDTCDHTYDACPSDGLFCNGVEACDYLADACYPPSDPCTVDDGIFCNGPAACDENSDTCVPFGNPCSDEQFCSETTAACTEELMLVATGTYPTVSAWADGRFVVGWRNSGGYYQIFGADGMPEGIPVKFASSAYQPEVNTCLNGGFVAGGYGINTQANTQFGIVYDNQGTVLVPQYWVGGWSDDQASSPTSIATFADCGALFSSDDCEYDGNCYAVYHRRNSSGGVVGSVVILNSGKSSAPVRTRAAVDANGNIIGVWGSTANGILADRYFASGTTNNDKAVPGWAAALASGIPYPDVAVDNSFNATVVWSHAASGADVFMARLAGQSSATFGAFTLVNGAKTSGDQTAPVVAVNASGNGVIAWTSSAYDSEGKSVWARRFNSAGSFVGDPFLVNVSENGDQSAPSVTIDDAGMVVIVWASTHTGVSAIFMRRFPLP